MKIVSNQVIFIGWYRKTVKIYRRKSFSLNPDSKECLKFRLGNLYLRMYFSWYLPARTECNYRETGCSFARHFAILSRNVGILIGSLLRASCDSNFNLLPEQTVFHIGILWRKLTAMASNISSVSKREKIISLWSSGYRNKEICSRLHLSHQTVSNILSKFLQNGTAAPGKPGWKERTVATPNVVEFVEYCKVFKPSTRTFEIQQGLLANAICTPANLPARSTISDIVRQDLHFTWKKLSVHPAECLTHKNLLKTLNYIMYMLGVDPSTIHFFDETLVVKTTPNRSYGHSKKGLPAVEIQRYASNCNYTVNLLHSRFGIDNFNILEGPKKVYKL